MDDIRDRVQKFCVETHWLLDATMMNFVVKVAYYLTEQLQADLAQARAEVERLKGQLSAMTENRDNWRANSNALDKENADLVQRLEAAERVVEAAKHLLPMARAYAWEHPLGGRNRKICDEAEQALAGRGKTAGRSEGG